MKYCITLMALVLVSGAFHSIFAQSSHQFGIKTGPLYAFRKINSYESDLYKTHRNNNETGLWGGTVELNYYYKINSTFRISTGVGFLKQGFQTKDKWLIDPCYSSVTCGFRYELYQYHLNYLKVPLRISFASEGKFHIATEAGISGLFLLDSNVNWVLRREKQQRISQKIERRANTTDLERLHLGLDFSMGLGYAIAEKMTIRLQPELNYLLMQYENTDIRDEIYDINRFADENKTTQERLLSYGINLSVIKTL